MAVKSGPIRRGGVASHKYVTAIAEDLQSLHSIMIAPSCHSQTVACRPTISTLHFIVSPVEPSLACLQLFRPILSTSLFCTSFNLTRSPCPDCPKTVAPPQPDSTTHDHRPTGNMSEVEGGAVPTQSRGSWTWFLKVSTRTYPFT